MELEVGVEYQSCWVWVRAFDFQNVPETFQKMKTILVSMFEICFGNVQSTQGKANFLNHQ